MNIAVIGIGQSLRGDDAAGLEAIRQWQETFIETAGRPEVRVEACELPGPGLLDLFADARAVILVDAVQSGAAAGHIHRLGTQELAAFAVDSKSAHGWGVAETLELARQLGQPLPHIRVVGIEAESMQIGTGLSAAVKQALPAACLAIEAELALLSKFNL